MILNHVIGVRFPVAVPYNMIHFDIVTIFPEVISAYINSSIVKRAQEKGIVKINVHNLRNWATDKHRSVDDTPYGGGPGMVMKVEPIFNCLKDLRKKNSVVMLTSPRGDKLVQSKLKELSEKKDAHYIVLCGHYEGFDQRVHDFLVDYEFSIGEYVLSGGELPALVFVDGITRLIPGVLGNEESLISETFNSDTPDFPQYINQKNLMDGKFLMYWWVVIIEKLKNGDKQV